jgi:pimeloyl-ACP methyl ester carboxylesterase
MVRDHALTGASYPGPTLIVWGDLDAFTLRADQDTLVKAFAHATLLAYEGIGHAVHWEVPARFVGDLVQWLAQIEWRLAGRAA